MSISPLRLGAPVAILAFALVACGGSTASNSIESTTGDQAASTAGDSGTDASDSAAASDPSAGETGGLCAIVPSDEVETALGAPHDGGVGDESFLTEGTTCRFTADADHVLDVETSEQTRDEWFEAIETVGLTDEPVEGVGEEAYRAAETALGGPGARFTAWSEGHEVGVTVYSDVDQATTFAAAQAIAEAILAEVTSAE